MSSFDPTTLGGGVKGSQPTLLHIMDGGGARGVDRNVLREGFGQSRFLKNATGNENLPIKVTPFRLAMNAGDINGSVNSAPIPQLPAPSQINGQKQSKLHARGDGVRNNGSAGYSGNPKYVYDGSDYTRYKKLAAMNKTYNDRSFGGSNNGAYSFLMRVRR